ncbi:hypothetical protein COM38_00680 [Bacillus toyonensis]|uniref:Uncharacterized protein n=1 Tax=Bacillus toyonensis TaxID=155322 RepID=A0AB36T9J1_9BACI|nr:hypothetical protein CON55_19985 [Bacillus toyonensis]PKR93884.1 hypothetical protein bcere0024_06820 [Bacillus cereus Rock4-18]PED95343.1 hypothetical protein CON90_09690 [Bacillus toyonensis]PEJ63735.1 hypothetical protein CN906_11335 [Bacillus toyonensis]PEK53143.1 hypothetical protein CN588_05760 [Bacillus toyonensis]
MLHCNEFIRDINIPKSKFIHIPTEMGSKELVVLNDSPNKKVNEYEKIFVHFYFTLYKCSS